MRPKSSRPRDVERWIESKGFRFYKRNSGGSSHRHYVNSLGQTTCIPWHSRDLMPGTLRSIIKDVDSTVEEFNREV